MAIKLDISNAQVDLNSQEIRKISERISGIEKPPFATHEPNFREIKSLAGKYRKKRNVIILGNGGSINNIIAFHGSLKQYVKDKNVYMVRTMEPSYLKEIRDRCPKKDTLVVPVSKSGTNICPLEGMLYFSGYDMLFITSLDRGVLIEISKKHNIDVMEHPDIGGRFTGRTSCPFGPAELLGIPITEINKGALSMYKSCDPDVPLKKNPAKQLAVLLYSLEKKGYIEIFCPIYSVYLSSFSMLIIQLMHESVCKNGQGQTILCEMGPEIQHHTTQRFFGGKKNMVGVFVVVDKHDESSAKISVQKDLRDIPLRNGSLGDLDGLNLSRALKYEFEGVHSHAIHDRIPNVVISVSEITPRTVGEFLAFWQYVAMYSSAIRGVNPYNQPEVEYAKDVSFRMIRKK
jgi:glucose-6-phosphate isomerase